jgi:hypothetical protein
LIATLATQGYWVDALILLKNNSLVSGTTDNLNVWNQKNESAFECVATLNLGIRILSLAISGSSLLISGHSDGTIQIRNQTSFFLFQTLKTTYILGSFNNRIK